MGLFVRAAWYNEHLPDASTSASSKSDAKGISVLFSNPDVEELVLLPSPLI